MDLREMGARAKDVSRILGKLGQTEKNAGLFAAAGELEAAASSILEANGQDVDAAVKRGMHAGLVDRLRLDGGRIKAMADGLRDVAALEDPVGEVESMKKRPNGLLIGRKRVPLGVIGIIYEARPNVTADAFGLCFKSGNAVILRGGSDAIRSNEAIVAAIRRGLLAAGLPEDAVQLVADTSRESARELMRLNGYLTC